MAMIAQPLRRKEQKEDISVALAEVTLLIDRRHEACLAL